MMNKGCLSSGFFVGIGKKQQAQDLLSAQIIEAAREFVDLLKGMDAHLARSRRTLPDDAEREIVAEAFHEMMFTVEILVRDNPVGNLTGEINAFRGLVGPWLCRSDFFRQWFFMSKGCAGEHRVADMVCDLNGGMGYDPAKRGIVNCLDYLFSELHSVESMRERRKWLVDVLESEYQRSRGAFRVLDIACGSSRHLRDFLDRRSDCEGIDITLTERDPAVIAYSLRANLDNWRHLVGGRALPLSMLRHASFGKKFDVIIASGPFDYLKRGSAEDLAAVCVSHLKDGGCLVLTNHHRSDRSALAKEWLGHRKPVGRHEWEVKQLLPAHVEVSTKMSACGSLVLASARKQPANQECGNEMEMALA